MRECGDAPQVVHRAHLAEHFAQALLRGIVRDVSEEHVVRRTAATHLGLGSQEVRARPHSENARFGNESKSSYICVFSQMHFSSQLSSRAFQTVPARARFEKEGRARRRARVSVSRRWARGARAQEATPRTMGAGSNEDGELGEIREFSRDDRRSRSRSRERDERDRAGDREDRGRYRDGRDDRRRGYSRDRHGDRLRDRRVDGGGRAWDAGKDRERSRDRDASRDRGRDRRRDYDRDRDDSTRERPSAASAPQQALVENKTEEKEMTAEEERARAHGSRSARDLSRRHTVIEDPRTLFTLAPFPRFPTFPSKKKDQFSAFQQPRG